jgi:hypothetical protein
MKAPMTPAIACLFAVGWLLVGVGGLAIGNMVVAIGGPALGVVLIAVGKTMFRRRQNNRVRADETASRSF